MINTHLGQHSRMARRSADGALDLTSLRRVGLGSVLQSAVLASALLALSAACGRPPQEAADQGEQRLKVVATTSIVADVVRQVGGEAIELVVLLPVGADPHGFEAMPQDVVKVTEADVIFANGVGLEQFVEPLLENAGGDAEMVEVSRGVDLQVRAEDPDDHQHGREAADPHVWTDPNNVVVWTAIIEETLSRLDPENRESYRTNAESYRVELAELDSWIREQVEQVRPENRLLVTDHLVFGYFAERYGFEQAGAIFPGSTTVAQPSARELAELEDRIQEWGVKALFVGSTVSPGLAQQVTEDTGIPLVSLYTGSLTAPGGDAGTYLEYVRYNVGAIVGALK